MIWSGTQNPQPQVADAMPGHERLQALYPVVLESMLEEPDAVTFDENERHSLHKVTVGAGVVESGEVVFLSIAARPYDLRKSPKP